MKKTHYEILEIASSSSEAMVRLAYERISKTLGDKIASGDRRATYDLWAAKGAYEVLSNPARRKLYDEMLTKSPADNSAAERNPEQSQISDRLTIDEQPGQSNGAEEVRSNYVAGTRLVLGVTGSSMVMLGVFAPLVSIPIIGSMNWFASGKGDGVLVLVLGLVSLFLTLIARYRGLFYTGVGIVGFLAFFVLSFNARLSTLKHNMDGGLAGRLAEAATSVIQIQWGAGMLLVGAILVIAAAVYGIPPAVLRQQFIGDAKRVIGVLRKPKAIIVFVGLAAVVGLPVAITTLSKSPMQHTQGDRSIAGALPYSTGIEVPPLKARVTDLAGTLNDDQSTSLERRLARFEASKGAQIAVLIVPTTQPETIEQYSIRVVEQWKLGRKGVDDGVLLIVAKNDRMLRIEVGLGFESAIPDAMAKKIVSDIIAPYLRKGDYYGGITAGVEHLIKVIEG